MTRKRQLAALLLASVIMIGLNGCTNHRYHRHHHPPPPPMHQNQGYGR
ncbi:MAG: hypothetical protein ABI076_09605 [Acidobacteriaceae bacterium]